MEKVRLLSHCNDQQLVLEASDLFKSVSNLNLFCTAIEKVVWQLYQDDIANLNDVEWTMMFI